MMFYSLLNMSLFLVFRVETYTVFVSVDMFLFMQEEQHDMQAAGARDVTSVSGSCCSRDVTRGAVSSEHDVVTVHSRRPVSSPRQRCAHE